MVVTKEKRTVSLVLGSLFFATSMINSYAMPNISENVTNDISDVWSVHYTTQVIEKALEPTPSPIPEPTPSPTPTPTPLNQKAVETAKQYLGVPYVWGGTTPSGFDCSGLVQYVYGQIGVNISRTTYTQVNEGRYVSRDELLAGDLVFFGDSSSPHHVGMYIGDGLMIHAPQTGDVVKIADLSARSDYATARRIVE